jgi:hypothetical protein
MEQFARRGVGDASCSPGHHAQNRRQTAPASGQAGPFTAAAADLRRYRRRAGIGLAMVVD